MSAADDLLDVGPMPRAARGLVLMLHGGAEHGTAPTGRRSLAYRRTRAMSAAIAGPLAAAGVGLALLRFSVKGWNASGGMPSPVLDARAALARLHAEHAGLPVVLVGHSMGGRTAAWVADDPGVVGVVGLAPWLPPDDPIEPLAGKHLVAAHGSRDRITSARATARYVQRAAEVAASARFVDMGPVGHYLVAGVRRWNATAIEACLGILGVAGVTPPS